MRILYTAFNGKNNSSKILLDCMNVLEENKLYLKNSFETSVKQLENKIKKNQIDLIISFGQAPLMKDTIKIETTARKENCYQTKYNYFGYKKQLEDYGYSVIVSNDAGNYFCNHVYYYGLKYMYENHLKCHMIFIHIPKINNIKDIERLAKSFYIYSHT